MQTMSKGHAIEKQNKTKHIERTSSELVTEPYTETSNDKI